MNIRSGYDRYLEFQYRQTGDFFTALFRVIALADSGNTQKLMMAFPEEVDAYRIWTRIGADALLERVSLDHPLRKNLIEEYNLEDK